MVAKSASSDSRYDGDGLAPLPIDERTWKAVAKRLGLSPQQTNVVRLLLRQAQRREIAKCLRIAEPTVGTYLNRMYRKLGVKDRLGLVLHVFAVTVETIRE